MKERSTNEAQFISELEQKNLPLLNSNPNWIDEAKNKFGADFQINSLHSEHDGNEDVDVNCNSKEGNNNGFGCSGEDDISDEEVIEAVALL